jgi:hypothetical protein
VALGFTRRLLPLEAAGLATVVRAADVDALAGWLSASVPESSRATGMAARRYRTVDLMAAPTHRGDRVVLP